ncbi:hypothetical protein D3C72_2086750 [compost metagenome]
MPPRKIPGERRVRQHHMVGKTGTIREREAAGTLRARGVCGVVEEDAARFQMTARQFEKFGRQQVGDIGAEMPGRIGNDGIEAAFRIQA